jgi:hypothetical protein
MICTEQLQAMEMPEEVLAHFDRGLGATMEASLEKARGQRRLIH